MIDWGTGGVDDQLLKKCRMIDWGTGGVDDQLLKKCQVLDEYVKKNVQ